MYINSYPRTWWLASGWQVHAGTLSKSVIGMMRLSLRLWHDFQPLLILNGIEYAYIASIVRPVQLYGQLTACSW